MTELDKLVRLPTCILLAALASGAQAEELRDPTRPPAVAMSGGMEQVDDTSPLLQSVLIGPDRRSAIINGQLLQIGSRVGDARLVRIEEDRVILRSGGATSTLRLFPVVDMKQARTEPKNEVKASSAARPKKKAVHKSKKTISDPSQ